MKKNGKWQQRRCRRDQVWSHHPKGWKRRTTRMEATFERDCEEEEVPWRETAETKKLRALQIRNLDNRSIWVLFTISRSAIATAVEAS
ncbi:unnamed protein product [Linum trigynum]|uniref:Uncharacterized protein n=1 Tax=Linum trigynum TaxID=586398 RepID=A0AAV2FE45_9ROSI